MPPSAISDAKLEPTPLLETSINDMPPEMLNNILKYAVLDNHYPQNFSEEIKTMAYMMLKVQDRAFETITEYAHRDLNPFFISETSQTKVNFRKSNLFHSNEDGDHFLQAIRKDINEHPLLLKILQDTADKKMINIVRYNFEYNFEYMMDYLFKNEKNKDTLLELLQFLDRLKSYHQIHHSIVGDIYEHMCKNPSDYSLRNMDVSKIVGKNKTKDILFLITNNHVIDKINNVGKSLTKVRNFGNHQTPQKIIKTANSKDSNPTSYTFDIYVTNTNIGTTSCTLFIEGTIYKPFSDIPKIRMQLKKYLKSTPGIEYLPVLEEKHELPTLYIGITYKCQDSDGSYKSYEYKCWNDIPRLNRTSYQEFSEYLPTLIIKKYGDDVLRGLFQIDNA